jgi:predicted ATPase
MLIKEVELSNFKGVENGKVTLSPLTILIGSNNAAKSTILESLFLAPNPFRDVPYSFPDLNIFHQKLLKRYTICIEPLITKVMLFCYIIMLRLLHQLS